MAPTRKEQYEKNAWSWVENCSPLEVTDQHIRTAYRVNLSRCKVGACRRNCRGNPFCLSNLGEHKWLGNHEDFVNDQVNDPEKERRQPGTYVGLKNLGATCYVNSLLQLWFHNLNFRKAIFMWDPLQDPEEKQNITIREEKYIPFSVLGHLQAVFALMQYGERRYVDPTDFISTLRLDTTIQQDAQEFSKLFLSKLETVLSYQSSKEVRDLIKDNFCGEYSYVTRCMKCKMESKHPSTFYELDLNIKGHKTIQDCLKEFIYIEMLEGDDKYFCQVCGEKQDAQRFISLTELPPVLNLQLMRFVFDKNTGYKKKLNTFVQFPDKLNMTEFCPKVKGNLEYTLSAVLVHGGRSANSGHYVAHICDSESGTWYKFNDESVEKIEGKKLKLGTEDEYEDGGKKVKIPRAPKGSYHSLNAYMLVYTRNDVIPTPSSVETKPIEWNLPPHLQNFVDDQNLQFENWVIDMRNSNDATVGRSQNQQIEMATNITLLSVDVDSDNFEAVPTSWLTHWLSDPDDEGSIDNEKYTCSHGKLDPSEISNVKYINSETAEKLFDKYGGDRRLKRNEFECRSCVVRKCFKIRVKNKTQNEVKIITNKVKAKLNENEPAYWVGKTSLRSWRRLALENLENGLLDYNCIEILNDSNAPNKSSPFKYENRESAGKEESNETAKFSSNRNSKNIYRTSNGDHEPMHIDGMGGDEIYFNCGQRETLDVKFSQHVISRLDELISLTSNSSNEHVMKLNFQIERAKSSFKHAYESALHKFVSSGDMKGNEVELKNEPKLDKESTPVSSYNGAFYNFLQNREKTLVLNENNVEELNGRQNYVIGPAGDESTEQADKHDYENDEKSPISQTDEPKPIPCCVEVTSENEALPNGDVEPGRAKSVDNEDESSTSETRFNEDLLCCHGNLCVEENNRKLVPEEVWRMLKKYFPNVNEFNSQASPCNLCKSLAEENEVAKGIYRNEAVRQKEYLLDLFLDRNRPQFKPQNDDNENIFYIVNKEFITSWRKFIRENGKKAPPYYIKNQSLLCHEHSGLLYDLNIDTPPTIVLVTREEWEQLKIQRQADCEISVRCTEDGTIVSKPEVCHPCMCDRIENEEKAQLCYSKAKIYIKVQNDEELDPLSSEEPRLPAKRVKLTNQAANGGATCINLNGGSNNAASQSSANGNKNIAGATVTITDASSMNGVESTWSNEASPTVIENNIDEVSNEVCQNGTVGNATSSCNGPINGKMNAANGATINGNGLATDSVGVRRSSRCRKVRGIKELIVSSDLTLLDVKKKICEMMSVAPMDQHLSTSDGRILTQNTATLTELSIFPDTVLNLKVDEPCDGVIADDFIASREPEAGFKGTSLVGS